MSNGLPPIAFLTDSDGGSSQQETIAAQINQFTSTPNQSPLQLQQSGRTKASLFGLFSLIGMGFGRFMALSPATTCTFYKRLNQVVLENKIWYGGRCSVEYPLNRDYTKEKDVRQVTYHVQKFLA